MPENPIVLITGASGFIGRALAARFKDRYTVVGLDRPGSPAAPGAARAIDLDLASDESVARALGEVRGTFGNQIASVVHLAAYYDISGEPNPLYDEITVQGSRRLIDGLQAFAVEQFAFASTMLVHRPTERPDRTIDEDSPIEPSWAYPASKVRTEAMLRETHGRIPIVLLRIAGVYDDLAHSPFITEQVARIYEHRLIAHFYPGMLCAGQSFIHIDDLTDAVLRLIERRQQLPPEGPLLIGKPEALGYAEIQNIIGESLHGEDWATVRVPKTLAKAGAWLPNEVLGGRLHQTVDGRAGERSLCPRHLAGAPAAMANSDHLVGALVLTIAIIAMAEVARIVLGLALIGLSLPRGRRSSEHSAGWDRYIV